MRFFLRLFSKILIVNTKASTGLSSSRFSFFKNLFYKVGTQLLIDKKFPIQVGLELSRACNFDCPFCSRLEAEQGNHLDFDLAKKVIDEASIHGPTVFTSHMWGEPLLNPNWLKFYSYIKSKSRHHGISLTTNGFLLSKKVSRELIDIGADEVIVSLHTFNKDEYKVRVGKDIEFDLVYENIQTLLSLKSKTRSRIKVVVRVFERGHDFTSCKEYRELIRCGAVVENDFYDNSAGTTQKWSQASKSVKRYPCFHPWLTTTISFKGEVSLCCVDNKMSLKIGDIHSDSLTGMWSNQKVKLARQEHLNGEFEDFCKICKGCDTWSTKPNFFFSYQYRGKRSTLR